MENLENQFYQYMTTVLQPGDFPKLRLRAFAPVQERETSEAKYWRKFAESKEIILQGSPNTIDFHPINGNSYLITHSTKISLYQSANDKLQRSYSRFSDDAFSGRFRKDGKLIISGDRSGNIKVFDVKTKSALRDIKAHTASVHVVNWTSDGLYFISGSDDKKVKRWDLGTEELVWQSTKGISQHDDYVRALSTMPGQPNGFISGSYDHSVRIWDSRQQESIAFMDHGCPVEYCVISPSGSMAFSAGGNEIKIWDMLAGGRLLHTFNNHQKNITSLCMNDSGSKLFSSGLDGFVKVYSVESLQVIHSMKHQGPCLSVRFAPNDSKLITGLVDGTVIVRNKEKTVNSDEENDEEDRPVAGKRQRRHYKGAGHVMKAEEGLVETDRPTKLQPYESHLRKFNYQRALDSAMTTRNPIVVVTVLEELVRRNGLIIALSGRDEETLEPILSFVARYISNPRYSSLIAQVSHYLLDIYAPIIGQSDAIDELFMKLHQHVKLEIGFQRQAQRVVSALDCVINISSMKSSTTDNSVEDSL